MELKKIHSTKTHDIYEIPRSNNTYRDLLVIVSSDEISSPENGTDGLKISNKGVVANQLNHNWAQIIDSSYGEDEVTGIKFGWAKDFLTENPKATNTIHTAVVHPVALSSGVMPEEEYQGLQEILDSPNFAERSQVQLRLDMLPIDFIVRGYMRGSLWKSYKSGERVFCGIRLSDGISESDQLPEPIFTPRTKATADQPATNISFSEMVSYIDRFLTKNVKGIFDAKKIAQLLKDVSLYYYKRAEDFAKKRGDIIIADANFEYGIIPDAQNSHDCIMLGGDILTPESSSYWLVDYYEPGEPQDNCVTTQDIFNRLFSLPKNGSNSELENFNT